MGYYLLDDQAFHAVTTENWGQSQSQCHSVTSAMFHRCSYCLRAGICPDEVPAAVNQHTQSMEGGGVGTDGSCTMKIPISVLLETPGIKIGFAL